MFARSGQVADAILRNVRLEIRLCRLGGHRRSLLLFSKLRKLALANVSFIVASLSPGFASFLFSRDMKKHARLMANVKINGAGTQKRDMSRARAREIMLELLCFSENNDIF